jgi:hypothetical protein
LQDAWETTGKRMTLGLGLLGVTVILAIALATRQPVALLSFLAYPVVFAGVHLLRVSPADGVEPALARGGARTAGRDAVQRRAPKQALSVASALALSL